MATNRFLTPSDLLPAMGLLCSAASSEIDKIIESPNVAPEFQSVVKKYNSPVNTILHTDQMPSELKTIVTAVLADVSEVMVVLKSGQNKRKMGQRPADIMAAMSLPAWIEAAFDHGHAIIASKQRMAAVKKAASWSAEVQGVLTRNGLPMCVVTFGLEVRKNHIFVQRPKPTVLRRSSQPNLGLRQSFHVLMKTQPQEAGQVPRRRLPGVVRHNRTSKIFCAHRLQKLEDSELV